MNMNTNILIMNKINNGFRTKKDVILSNFVSENSALVKIKSEGIGLFFLESSEMTVEEINALAKKPMGKNKLKEILANNIYNAVMLISEKELRITAIPCDELLDSSMKGEGK